MIKQVWVAVNPVDPQDVEMRTTNPDEHDHQFDDGLFGGGVWSTWKPAMLIVEDVE